MTINELIDQLTSVRDAAGNGGVYLEEGGLFIFTEVGDFVISLDERP